MTVQFSPEDDILDICHSDVFKAIFTEGTPNSRASLSDLISAAVGFLVKVDSILQPNASGYRDKQTPINTLCRDNDGKTLNVELIVYPHQFEPLGIEFSMCELHTSQGIKETGGTLSGLQPTYQIIILAKRCLSNDQHYYHHFKYFDSDARRELGGMTHIITIELEKAAVVVEKDITEMSAMDRWVIFLKDCSDQSERGLVNVILKSEAYMAAAAETLLTISKDEGIRTRLLNNN